MVCDWQWYHVTFFRLGSWHAELLTIRHKARSSSFKCERETLFFIMNQRNKPEVGLRLRKASLKISCCKLLRMANREKRAGRVGQRTQGVGMHVGIYRHTCSSTPKNTNIPYLMHIYCWYLSLWGSFCYTFKTPPCPSYFRFSILRSISLYFSFINLHTCVHKYTHTLAKWLHLHRCITFGSQINLQLSHQLWVRH